MMHNADLIRELDETLTGLEKAIKGRKKAEVHVHVKTFTKLLGDSPGVLSENDLTRYGQTFSLLMEPIRITNVADDILAKVRKAAEKGDYQAVDEYRAELRRTLEQNRGVLKTGVRHYFKELGTIMETARKKGYSEK